MQSLAGSIKSELYERLFDGIDWLLQQGNSLRPLTDEEKAALRRIISQGKPDDLTDRDWERLQYIVGQECKDRDEVNHAHV